MCAHSRGCVEGIFYLHEWWRQRKTGACLWHVLPSWIPGSSEFLSCISHSESLFKCEDWRQSEFVFTRGKRLFRSIYLSWPCLLPSCISWSLMLPRWLSLAQSSIWSKDFLSKKRGELVVWFGNSYCPEDWVGFWVKHGCLKSSSTLDRSPHSVFWTVEVGDDIKTCFVGLFKEVSEWMIVCGVQHGAGMWSGFTQCLLLLFPSFMPPWFWWFLGIPAQLPVCPVSRAETNFRQVPSMGCQLQRKLTVLVRTLQRNRTKKLYRDMYDKIYSRNWLMRLQRLKDAVLQLDT